MQGTLNFGVLTTSYSIRPAGFGLPTTEKIEKGIEIAQEFFMRRPTAPPAKK